MKLFKTLKNFKEFRKKKKALRKYGKYVAPNGIIYIDPTRWVSATKMRKYC